jgi:hypothetical protein
MDHPILAQPSLYDVAGDHNSPVLKGRRCDSCGYIFFPPQDFGCERCGAAGPAVNPIRLAGRGVLHSFACVHRHRDERVAVPFTVGVVLLDDGPAISAILASPTGEGLRIGDRMTAVLAPLRKDESGRSLVELRFANHEVVR